MRALGRDEEAPSFEALMAEFEARGLYAPVIARLLFSGYILLSLIGFMVSPLAAQIGHLPAGLVWAPAGAVAVALLVNAQFLRLLRARRHVRAVGWFGAVSDVVGVGAQLGAFLMIGTAFNARPGFVWHSELVPMCSFFIVLNGLALYPRYPLVVGAGLFVLLAALGVHDAVQGAAFTLEFEQVLLGTAVDPMLVVNSLVFVAGTTGLMFYTTRGARRLAREALSRQVENARLQREQAEVVLKEKIGALAKLVAGVSHEINTPLGVLESGIDTTQRALDKLEEAASEETRAAAGFQRALKIARTTQAGMKAAADRVASTQSSLRSFGHLDEAEFQKADLLRELDLVIERLPPDVKARGTLHRRDEVVPPLHCRPKELGQAFFTLLENAFEALEPPGEVELGCRVVDGHVEVRIRDHGRGLNEDEIKALFDVRFNTSASRVRAGLGLATALSVVHHHGGRLEVESAPGEGTDLRVLLPLV